VSGFRTIFVPSFPAAFLGTCNSVPAGEAIVSWVSELYLGQDKESSRWLFWEGGGVFLAPSIFSVNTFQFATNFCSLTFTLRTMHMVMDILNIYMR
jgi:hypothetical protein